MKERPILFSGPMVRAIIEGRKTQTRRVVKNAHVITCDDRKGATDKACPFGVPGDRLWVRETARVASVTSGKKPWYTVEYKAGGPDLVRHEEMPGQWFPRKAHNAQGERLWSPAIHVPRWGSRLTLEVVGVRVERLRAISEADAIAEGIERLNDGRWKHYQNRHYAFSPDPWESFGTLWRSISGERSWAANPWVWVVEFRRVEGG